MTDQIQADYEALEKISKQFDQLEDKVTTLRGKILASYQGIKDGTTWEGQAARAFVEDMDSNVLPQLSQLDTAMNNAAVVTTNIARKFREAEEAIKASSPKDGS